ncbi:b137 [Murid betaherpesvirus 8]|uniref:B137 n=1 Tax=Rat cytomegalovirus (isolate England) TaxID=1261657 RepID=A0A0E3SYB1_RCMVE|nr:b137 [Murid betaherpesvirus 8]WPH25034.1 b137 [Murid betaherpesvirus 8]WPH25168.1 b137 [Murid betaherpesvirus 8]
MILFIMGFFLVYIPLLVSVLSVSSTSSLDAPPGWDPSFVKFNRPTRTRDVYDGQTSVLNCSFYNVPDSGFMGWMRCPPGPNSDTCRYMWIEYNSPFSFTGTGTYDDGHVALVSVHTQRINTGNVTVFMGLELRSVFENLGGHACIVVSPRSGLTDKNLIPKYSSFILTAGIDKEILIRGHIMRARFSVANNIVPDTNSFGASLLRVKNGPVVQFEGRIHALGSEINTSTISFTKIKEPDATVFSLTVDLSDDDIGFSIELDDGHGGLLGRTGVHTKKRRKMKLLEIFALFATLIVSLVAVTIAVPHAETPFSLWCALCVGWLLHDAAD